LLKKRIPYGAGDCGEVRDPERGLVFGGILEMVEGVSLTWSPSRVEDRSCLRFWHDMWCEEATLEFLFLKLYSIAWDKEALVSDYMDSSSTYVHWNLTFLRAVQD